MTIFRRFLVLAALFFWQGGFTFYASVAVPIGREELGPRSSAAVITSRVSYYLNVAGAVGLVPLLWDILVSDLSPWRRRVRSALWALLLLTLVLQVYLHALMSKEVYAILSGLDPPYFHLQHRVYLWACTVQLAAAVGYMVCALLAWRAQDRAAAASTTA
jgi:hypothetical protein